MSTNNVPESASNELESQFILRLPEAPATVLRDVLKNAGSGSSLKDRLRIQIENDMRHGTIYLDEFSLPGKIVDLPCIIESHKTIDRKNIYKTADICQMMICTETEEPEEESKPAKKKDGVPKVDKKYLYSHGITPPLKNVRKRRFRRTLKKKQYMDQPEIEKEVRRLLRQDYEAHHVSWEVVDEEDDKKGEGGGKDILMQGSKTNEDPRPGSSGKMDVEHIFGEALSDSDEEEGDMVGGEEMDDESRLSTEEEGGDDSRSHLSDSAASYSQDTNITNISKKSSSSYVTSFSGDMFGNGVSASATVSSSVVVSSSSTSSRRSPDKSSPRGATPKVRTPSAGSSGGFNAFSRADLLDQRNMLKNQLVEINARRQIQEAELSTIDNMALRQRLETGIERLSNEEMEKDRQIQEVELLLSQSQD